MIRRFLFLTMSIVVLFSAGRVPAQESGSGVEQLSKKAANPLADLISVPLQNNTNFGLGRYDRTGNVLNIQPVVPFANGKIITRTIAPVVWIPDFRSESGLATWGLGDIVFTAFYAPPTEGMVWGVGAACEIPTGGEERGTQKWSLGPSAVCLVQPGNWTFGALANNIWSFAGESAREDVNQGYVNIFLVYQIGNGWYANSAPIITVNWKAEEGQKWIVPLGLGAGKVSMVGRMPINAQVGFYAMVVKPDFGPDWQFRAQLQFFLPKPGGGKG